MKNCITCGRPYKEPEDEAYLCPPCLEERKSFLKEVDMKHPPQPTPARNYLPPNERFAQFDMRNILGGRR